MRLGKRVVEHHGSPRVADCSVQQFLRRRILRPRLLVRRQLRAGEAGVGERVSRIDRDGPLEVRNGLRDLPDIECLELQPPFCEGPVRLKARRLARAAAPRDEVGRNAELLGKLRDHAVLKLEDVRKEAVDFGVGQRLAVPDVDDTSR